MTDDKACIDALALSHGQARWALGYFNMRVGDDEGRLDTWLKYVRRMGVPFDAGELGTGTGHNVTYRYPHLMELAVAMALRAQGILPRDLLGLLSEYREALRPLYRRAWLERESGLGRKIQVQIKGRGKPIFGAGTFLQLRLDYSPSGLLIYSEPELIGPADMVEVALRKRHNVYDRPPLPLSNMAADIVRLAEGAPEIRRGRP